VKLAALRLVFISMGHLCKEMLLSADEALQAQKPRRHARKFLFICQKFFN
jgi:hypothetical protein